MSELRNRLLKNSGMKVLNEDAGDKLKELEIKERAQRLISNFQREVLGLAQYIEKGCVYSYDRDTTPLNDEVRNQYKKTVGSFLMAKMPCLTAMVADSFGEDKEEEKENDEKEDGDSEGHNEVSVVMTTPEPSSNPVIEKKSLFPY